MTYDVYDNGKPAKYPDIRVDCSWNNNSFSTFDESVAYAKHWVGDALANFIPPEWDGRAIDYSGAGDLIEIREE